MKKIENARIAELLKSGRWMVRMDKEGESYEGFRWAPIGEWTSAPDWSPSPICGHGLHGQSPAGHGYSNVGTRLCLCETREQVVVDGNKIKTPTARIIAVNEDIPVEFFPGITLSLWNYAYPLPSGLTTIGGDIFGLTGYDYPLPSGLTTIGGNIFGLTGYAYPLPSGLTTIGGDIRRLASYDYPLPSGLTTIGGDIYLDGYAQPLPSGLTTIGGDIFGLTGYDYPLPSGLTTIGGDVFGYEK